MARLADLGYRGAPLHKVVAERRHRGDNPSPEEVQRVTRQETLSILRIEPALGEPLVRAVEPLLDQLR